MAGKPFFACKFGNCTNFAGFLCRNCGRMMCRQHYNTSKSLCLACAAPAEKDGECLPALVGSLIGTAVLIGIVILIYNLIPKPPPPPWHVELSSDTAQHSGRFDNNDPNNVNSAWSELQASASLTFTGITLPKAGTYRLSLNGDNGTEASGWYNAYSGPSKEDYTLSVLVNGKVQATFHLVEEGGSTHPIDIPLQAGQNTIQVKLDGHDDTYDGQHTYVIIAQIVLDQETT